MKVTRAQADENRERVLDAAARLFREHGFDGIGVAGLMKGAGLTHGGFYGHFASKEDLMAQACARAMEVSVEHWRKLADQATGSPLKAITKPYLSAGHRDRPGRGCAVAALGTDVARQGPPVRRAVTAGVRALVDILARLIAGKSAAMRRREALAIYASMVGAVVLARAVDDPALSEEVLQAVSASILDVG